ncbi:hypothetical protein J6590_066330 [Homalodisca vitripennis]|nr:hypothetical protein J6590_066330 [Homalodisca vitripennis]
MKLFVGMRPGCKSPQVCFLLSHIVILIRLRLDCGAAQNGSQTTSGRDPAVLFELPPTDVLNGNPCLYNMYIALTYIFNKSWDYSAYPVSILEDQVAQLCKRTVRLWSSTERQ